MVYAPRTSHKKRMSQQFHYYFFITSINDGVPIVERAMSILTIMHWMSSLYCQLFELSKCKCKCNLHLEKPPTRPQLGLLPHTPSPFQRRRSPPSSQSLCLYRKHLSEKIPFVVEKGIHGNCLKHCGIIKNIVTLKNNLIYRSELRTRLNDSKPFLSERS